MSDHIAKYMKKHNNTKPTPKQLQLFTKKQKDLSDLTFKEARALIENYEKETSKNPNTKHSKKNSNDKAPEKKKSVPEKPLYAVDDEILLTKDRMGIVRYVGKIEGLNENAIYYGVELTNGAAGTSDGVCKGNRYFQTDGDRAVFTRASEIRRKMTERDHKRLKSYDLTKQIKDSMIENKIMTPKQGPVVNNEIIDEQPLDTIKSSEEIQVEDIENNETVEQENEEKTQEEESNDNQSSEEPTTQLHQSEESELTKYSPTPDEVSTPQTVITTDNNNTSNGSNNLDVNGRLNVTNKSPQVSLLENTVVYNNKFSKINENDNIIEYIFKQDELLRLELLDIYANPTLNPLVINTFNQLKNIDSQKQQNMVWESLIYRWKKYLTNNN